MFVFCFAASTQVNAEVWQRKVDVSLVRESKIWYNAYFIKIY
jgi:hypothetical protein